MAVKERGRERGAISRIILEERERGVGGRVGNSKKEEGGRRKEMDKDKTVRRGWKRKHAVKAKDSLRASSPIWASETSLARMRVLERPASLAQIGELARRPTPGKPKNKFFLPRIS